MKQNKDFRGAKRAGIGIDKARYRKELVSAWVVLICLILAGLTAIVALILK